MSEPFEIAGFRVSLEGDEAVCRFASRDEPGADPPPSLEQDFRDELQPGGRLAGKRLVVFLDTMPAMSSRQLGSLLAIHRAAGADQKLVVRGVRRNIRQLFDLTRMDKFFDY
jgi:hypothetical protein